MGPRALVPFRPLVLAGPWGVVFDNDGVLVDTEAYSEHAYQVALAEQGIAVNPEDAERYCGLTDADILRDMQQRYHYPVNYEQFSARKRELYFETASVQPIRIFPGAAELLSALRVSGIPVALASSAPHEKIQFNLEQSGLKPFFSHIISGEDFQRGKPDPEIFLKAAALLQIEPARCVVIEDSINGLKAARAAGMAAIGVTNTFSADKLMPYADEVVHSLESLSIPRLEAAVTAGGRG